MEITQNQGRKDLRYIWLVNRLEKRWMIQMPLNPANSNAQD